MKIDGRSECCRCPHMLTIRISPICTDVLHFFCCFFFMLCTFLMISFYAFFAFFLRFPSGYSEPHPLDVSTLPPFSPSRSLTHSPPKQTHRGREAPGTKKKKKKKKKSKSKSRKGEREGDRGRGMCLGQCNKNDLRFMSAT